MIRLTQEEYIALLRKQRDPNKRAQMKAFALAAMYGLDRDLPIYLPYELVEGLLGETRH